MMIDLSRWHLPDPVPDPANGESLRRPPRHSDEALTGTTRVWLSKLPTGRRPLELCTVYPRVANRIAWSWRDPMLARQVLEDLLADRRGGREGFSRLIVAELRRLRDFLDRKDGAESAAGTLDALLHFWPRH